MRLHRFIGEFNLNKDIVEIKDLELIKQIKSVLRLEVSDLLILCDGINKEAKVEIIQIEKGIITTKILELKEDKEDKKKVSLYLAILKRENFELALQKVVEIGVSEIIPVITERTVKLNLNQERLNKIIKEASEQSGRISLPTLSPILKFENAIIDGVKNEEKIIFHTENDKGLPFVNKNPNHKGLPFVNSSIFIGPEGGFTEEEVSFAKENNYKIESLGPATLRAETAAIVATYITINK